MTVHTLTDVVEHGRSLPHEPAYTGGSADRLAMILYTSGSTGAPKGAMITERTLATFWTSTFASAGDVPVFNVNFMPLNHLGGRLPLVSSFRAGGTSYFVPESDLSTLFEDWALVRPTDLALVPRVVDMLFQRYRSAVDRLVAEGATAAPAEAAAATELREKVLGGRVIGGFVGTAPLAREMKTFIDSVLDTHITDGYGTTEIGGAINDEAVIRPLVIDYKLVDVPELGYFLTDTPYPRGELLIKTKTMMPGYYKRPEVTAEVFDADGYYRTGDVMAETRTGPAQLCRPEQERTQAVAGRVRRRRKTGGDLRGRGAGAPDLRLRQQRAGQPARRHRSDAEALARFGGDTSGLKSALTDSLRETARAAELQSYEVPADFLIETDPFTAASGLLSGVGKMLRPRLKEQYGQRLEQLYAELAAARVDELRALRENAADRP